MKAYKNMTLALPSETAERLEEVGRRAGKSKRSLVIEAIEQYITVLEMELNTIKPNRTIQTQTQATQMESNQEQLLKQFREYRNNKNIGPDLRQLEAESYEDEEEEEEE